MFSDMNKLWWNLCKFLLETIDGMTSVFYWLAGVQPPLVQSGYTPGIDDSNLFLDLWNNPDLHLSKLFMGMAIIGVGILGIAVCIGFFKTQMFQQDSAMSTKRMLGKSAMSFIWIVIMPLLYFVAIVGVTALLNLVVSIMSSGAGGETESLGLIIGKSCLPNGAGVDAINEFRVDMTYSELKELSIHDSFNYPLCIVSGACVLVGLALSCFLVVERIIHIFLLYLVSPLILAKTPLDDGKSMEQWRDITLSKFLGIVGVIISMYLFFIMVKPINSIFTIVDSTITITETHTFYLTVARLVFLIGGVFAFTKAGHLFAHLIAQGSGQFEGMSQAQTMGLVSMGGRLAGRMIGSAKQGGRMAVGSMGGGMTGARMIPNMSGGNGSPMLMPAMGGSQALSNQQMIRSGGSPLGTTGTVGNTASGTSGGATNIKATATPMNVMENAKQGTGLGSKVKNAFGGGAGAGVAMMYGGIGGVLGYGIAKTIKGVGRLTFQGAKAVTGGIAKPINKIGFKKTGMTLSERAKTSLEQKRIVRDVLGADKRANKEERKTTRLAQINEQRIKTMQEMAGKSIGKAMKQTMKLGDKDE